MISARNASVNLFRSRFYSSASPKRTLKDLVNELRKLADVSPIQAGQALKASDMDVSKALLWLEKHRAESATRKAAKVEGRSANEGLVGTAVLSSGANGGPRSGVRAAMVELNCETDFVARNDLFANLLDDIAHTVAFMSEPVDAETFVQPFSLDVLQDAPLLSQSNPQQNGSTTVSDAMRNLTGRVGEKISLRRALTIVRDPLPSSQRELALRVTSRVHQSVANPKQGRIGSLALLALKSSKLSDTLASQSFRDDLDKLCQALGRQIIGFPTTSIRSPPGSRDECALYEQPFNMFSGPGNDQPVQTFLRNWAIERGLSDVAENATGVEVVEFVKWTVGETI
ncbi:uncharacterized protein FIBRA_00121 [Fibroporia radiculosa]|uniref:Elongation factor Ts, mitochondrial n=1 Tax=Fibroporia radiculosa TaxID=599839 RepID=J7RG97_9APHY|nr:uncharacterized protein FIBRA_00121 [Fibroporia radiculosa]CCL98127.1 predicted protein [Fibroporia radiculosa]